MANNNYSPEVQQRFRVLLFGSATTHAIRRKFERNTSEDTWRAVTMTCRKLTRKAQVKVLGFLFVFKAFCAPHFEASNSLAKVDFLTLDGVVLWINFFNPTRIVGQLKI